MVVMKVLYNPAFKNMIVLVDWTARPLEHDFLEAGESILPYEHDGSGILTG